MIDARTLALLDLLHCGHLVPARSHPEYDRLIAEWIPRYLVRLEAATQLLEIVATVQTGEAECSPST